MLGRTLGLDLGSHSIKVVELRQSLRAVEVVRLHAAPLRPELSEAEALRQLVSERGLATDRVVCALAGDRVTRRQIRFPFRDRRRIGQAVPYELEDDVPFDLEEVFVDWELVGESGSEAEVAATVVPRREVESRLACLREAGVEPRVLEAEGLVLAHLAELIPLPGARLLLDLGHRKTTACLLVDGRPRAARTIPLGARLVTEAIGRARGLDPDQAERVKHEEGVFGRGFESAVPGAVDALDRLARELVRTLGSLEATLGGPAKSTLTEITLLGGGARLHRVDEFLADRTGVRTARLQVPPSAAAGAFLAAGDPLRFAPALALALRGSVKARTRTNFLQGEYAPRLDLRAATRQLRWTVVLAAGVILLAAVSATTRFVLESRRADRLEQEIAQIWSQAAPGQPQPRDVARALEQTVRETRQRADFLGIYGGNLSALDLLTEISALIPAELAVVFEELSIDGQVVRIQGHTSSFAAVDQLRAALAASPSLGEIRVSEVQADAERGVNRFNLSISLGSGSPAS